MHHTLVKRKKTGRERQSKGGGRDDSGRFEWTIRAGARRRVAFGAVRATARADVGVDVDVGTTRTTRTTRTIEDRDARGGTAFSPRMVGRSFIRLARARNEKTESRQTRDDGWMTRTLGDVVRSSPSPGDGNVSSSRPRSRASSIVVADETRDVETIANECTPGYTPCNASHNSWLFAHGYIRES